VILVKPEPSLLQVALTLRFESDSDKVHEPSLEVVNDQLEPAPWYAFAIGLAVTVGLLPPPHP
jgi:hypothetical protein